MTTKEDFLPSIEEVFPGISANPVLLAVAVSWHEVVHKLTLRMSLKERSIVGKSRRSAEDRLGPEKTQQITEWHGGLDQHDY